MTDTNALIKTIGNQIILLQAYFACVAILDKHDNLIIYGFGRKIKAGSFFCLLGGCIAITSIFL